MSSFPVSVIEHPDQSTFRKKGVHWPHSPGGIEAVMEEKVQLQGHEAGLAVSKQRDLISSGHRRQRSGWGTKEEGSGGGRRRGGKREGGEGEKWKERERRRKRGKGKVEGEEEGGRGGGEEEGGRGGGGELAGSGGQVVLCFLQQACTSMSSHNLPKQCHPLGTRDTS